MMRKQIEIRHSLPWEEMVTRVSSSGEEVWVREGEFHILPQNSSPLYKGERVSFAPRHEQCQTAIGAGHLTVLG